MLFLEALSQYGNVSAAARHAGVSRNFVYSQRGTDAQFAAQWDHALTLGTEGLEDEARRRAFEGTTREQPYFYKGDEVGRVVIREYSDTLLIFLLKAHKPEKYRETIRQEHTGANGGPIETTLTNDERSRRLTALFESARARGTGSAAPDGEPEELPW